MSSWFVSDSASNDIKTVIIRFSFGLKTTVAFFFMKLRGFKANLILALAEGKSYSKVEAELKTSRPTIARWKARFEEKRMEGLEGQYKGSRPPGL